MRLITADVCGALAAERWNGGAGDETARRLVSVASKGAVLIYFILQTEIELELITQA